MTTMVMTVCMDRVLKFWHLNVLCRACFVSNNANLSISLEIKFRCSCLSHKNRFWTCILIVNMYSQMYFIPCFRNYLFKKKIHSIAIVSGKLHEWKIPERDVKQFKTNCSDISRTVFGSTEALLKHLFIFVNTL